jgi:hypothetical protein
LSVTPQTFADVLHNTFAASLPRSDYHSPRRGSDATALEPAARVSSRILLSIDPRIELFQVLNMVIGNSAINTTDTDYKIAIFQYFEKHRAHPIYEIARSKFPVVFEGHIDAPYSLLVAHEKDDVIVIYSTNEEDTEANERLIAYVKTKHSKYDFIPDTEALEMGLAKHNLFVIGTPWGSRFFEEHLPEIPVRLTANSLTAGKKYEGRGYALISGWINPSNPSNVMVIYIAQHPDDLINFNWVPRGSTDYMVLKHLIPMRADDYKRFSKIWTCY